MATKSESNDGHYFRNFIASENNKAKTYGIWIDMELVEAANPLLPGRLGFQMVVFKFLAWVSPMAILAKRVNKSFRQTQEMIKWLVRQI